MRPSVARSFVEANARDVPRRLRAELHAQLNRTRITASGHCRCRRAIPQTTRTVQCQRSKGPTEVSRQRIAYQVFHSTRAPHHGRRVCRAESQGSTWRQRRRVRIGVVGHRGGNQPVGRIAQLNRIGVDGVGVHCLAKRRRHRRRDRHSRGPTGRIHTAHRRRSGVHPVDGLICPS